MEPESAPLALAIDPGSDKCGVAVVHRSGEVVFRTIVPTSALCAAVIDLTRQYMPQHILCGNGTGSKPILRRLSGAGLSLPITPVDESYTSEAARKRYVAENPPRGMERLLPACLRTPSIPYDDYVAVILAERFWEGRE